MNRIKSTIFPMPTTMKYKECKQKGKQKREGAQFMAISIPPAKISIKSNP
jgi:hypothetical protein